VMGWYIGLAGIPLGAITSQSLLDFFLIMLGFLWLWDVFQLKLYKTNWGFQKIGIEWALLGYFLVVLLGVLFNSSRDENAWREVGKFTWVLNFYILIYSFQKIKLNPREWIPYFSFGFFFQSMYAIVGYFRGSDFITGRASDRVLGLLDSSTYHAHANAIVFIFFLGVLFYSWKTLAGRWKIIGLVSLLTLLWSVYLTYTRGVWVSLFVSTFIFLGFINKTKVTQLLLGGLALVISSYFLVHKFQERIHHAFDFQANGERIALFKANLDMFLNHPIAGVGPGENTKLISEYWKKWPGTENYILSHAHHQFLNVASTTGILGLFFFLWFWAWFLKRNYCLLGVVSFRPEESSKQDNIQKILLLICFCVQTEFTLACFTDIGFEYAKIRALLVFVWAMMVGISRASEEMNGYGKKSF